MTTLEGEGFVLVSHNDLDIVSQALMARFQLRKSEAKRIAHMTELLAIAAELFRALSTHTHLGLVHCQGSHGTSDLTADTRALFDALAAWSLQVRTVALEYKYLAQASDLEGEADAEETQLGFMPPSPTCS